MKLVSGIDLVEIKRFEEVLNKYTDRFIQRIYTPREISDVNKNTASLSARFAAKEAAAKALGTGIGAISWQEIEIVRNEAHQPALVLYGNAARFGELAGITVWSVSLSHTATYAVAIVIGLGE